jgi:hypothetical protein
MDVGVSVAIITGIFSVLVTLIQKARRENKSDHNMVYESLQDLKTDVRDVGTKLDNHIDWHLKK